MIIMVFWCISCSCFCNINVLKQQEYTILNMEMRTYFSLLCLHQETQLVFTQLPLITNILGTFVHSQIQGHKEVLTLSQILLKQQFNKK